MNHVPYSSNEQRWWRRTYRALSPSFAGRPFQSYDELDVSPESYRAIVDTAVDAILVTDHRGRIRSFNRGAEKIFGYKPGEVIGQNIKMLMPDPHRTQHDRYLDNYRRTGQRNIIGIGRAVEGLRKDGSLVPLELSIAEWIDGSGHKNFTGILHDITLHREQEINLQKAIEAAEAANRAKTDFR